MTQPVTDRDALLGALALRLNLLTAEALAAARGAWAGDPTRSLVEVLVARGLLREKELLGLEALVESQLERARAAGAQATLDTVGSSAPSADPFETRLPVGPGGAGAAPGTARS